MKLRNRIEPRQRWREQGVALITVMLVIALATMLAVSMMRSQHLSLRYADGLFSQNQAMLYTQGSEAFVQDLLIRDFDNDKRENKQVDHPGESWARPFPPFPVEGGMVNARLSDMQGRFNLNLLWHENAVNASAQTYLKQLMKNLDVPENLDSALIDWMDADNEPTGADGAEDDYYSRLPVPYRAANQSLADVSELLLIKGFTPAILERLRPYVCVLPSNALLNVNTAPPQVVRALTDSMTLVGAEELAQNRPADGYPSVDAYLDEPAFNGLEASAREGIKSFLAVRTGHFELSVDAVIGGRHSVLHAVLARGDSGTLRVVTRDYGRQFSSITTSAASLTDMTKTETR